MKTVLILTACFILLASLCFISLSCTKTWNCNCVARSPNTSDKSIRIKDPSKEDAKKTCDTYEHDTTNNLEYDCTLK